MSWRNYSDDRRHEVPDRSGDSVVPASRGNAKDYKNEPMSRDECERIMIAVGLMLNGYPVERRAIGEGFSLVIPAEWFRDKHLGVKAILARGQR